MMKLLSDEPISNEDEDIFGFKPYINMLGRTVVNSKKLPFTIGVVGEYGSGKTSIMQLLCNWLIKNGYKTIWFNPWSFKGSKELQGALIRAILLKFYMTSEKQSVKQTKNAVEIRPSVLKKVFLCWSLRNLTKIAVRIKDKILFLGSLSHNPAVRVYDKRFA